MKKRMVVVLVAAVAVVSLMGCNATTTKTYTETTTDADGNVSTTETTDENGTTTTTESPDGAAEAKELITYEFETFDNVKVVIDENSIVAQETADDPEYSDLVSEEARGNIIAPGRDFVYLEDNDYYYVADLSRKLITVADKSKVQIETTNDEELAENPGSFETDSWSITYDTDNWYGYVNEEGNTIINYLGECAGTSLIEISELDVPTAEEAVAILSEKKGKELTIIDAFEGEKCTCSAYAADEVYESGLYIADFYTLYEHNGKVIVLDEAITHDDDDARAEALGEVFAGVKNALVLK